MASWDPAHTSNMSLDIKILLKVSQAGPTGASKLKSCKLLRGCLRMAVATRGFDEKRPRWVGEGSGSELAATN